MIYKYNIYSGNRWRNGRISATSIEDAATLVKNIYEVEEKNSTIILNIDCEEFDDITSIKT